jgi:hypothetical protein
LSSMESVLRDTPRPFAASVTVQAQRLEALPLDNLARMRWILHQHGLAFLPSDSPCNQHRRRGLPRSGRRPASLPAPSPPEARIRAFQRVEPETG